MQSEAIASSSWRVNTLPVGLCGVLTMMSRVRGVTARRSSSGSKDQSGARSGTARWVAPAIDATAGYAS